VIQWYIGGIAIQEEEGGFTFKVRTSKVGVFRACSAEGERVRSSFDFFFPGQILHLVFLGGGGGGG